MSFSTDIVSDGIGHGNDIKFTGLKKNLQLLNNVENCFRNNDIKMGNIRVIRGGKVIGVFLFPSYIYQNSYFNWSFIMTSFSEK